MRARNNVILPRGTELFHGTIEPIEGAFRPGGDQLLWFADDPKIAQLYIPRAGLSVFSGPMNLVRPNRDPHVQAIQHALGIDYDLGAIEWDARGEPRSWPLPEGWDRLVQPEDIFERLTDLGFEPDAGRGKWATYRFYFDHDGSVMPPGGAAQGELFITAPTRDLRIADVTDLGGDLMNPAHLWIPLFRQLDELGYDGVLINDYAQSEEWGNFGHRSLGVFGSAIPDLEILDRVPANYEEFRFEGIGTRAWPRADQTDFVKLPADPDAPGDPALAEYLTQM